MIQQCLPVLLVSVELLLRVLMPLVRVLSRVEKDKSTNAHVSSSSPAAPLFGEGATCTRQACDRASS